MAEGSSGRSEAPSLTVASAEPLDQTRRTIATRLGESYREAVHVTVLRRIDAEGLLDAIDALDAAGRDASLVDVAVLALSAALAEHPRFNATFDGDELTMYEEHNVAVAVDTDRGLLAPVLDDVRSRAVEDVSAQRRAVTDRVLAGDHTLADLRGGTITVTNLGPLGVDAFTPIINPPQVAIVSLNRLTERVELDDGTEPSAVRELPVGVTFDHRVVDGADAARLLGTVAERLADAVALVGEE